MSTSDEFEPWPRPSPVLDRLGPFWRHRDDPLLVGFTVDDNKLNARGLLHGGVLAAFADAAVGHALAASTDPPTPLVTVNLNCDYTGTAKLGDWVEGIVTPSRVGRRMAVGTVVFTTGSRTVATVRGLFLP
nr:PaaI family thioesterase [Micromonospora sp. DSM 115978]